MHSSEENIQYIKIEKKIRNCMKYTTKMKETYNIYLKCVYKNCNTKLLCEN